MKPKLTLRDLFWLVLVVAMGLGWFVHYRHMQYDLEVAHKASKKVVITEIWLRRLGYYVDPAGALHEVK